MTSRKRRSPSSLESGTGARTVKPAEGSATIIHVDQPVLRYNRKHKACRPAIVIRRGATKILAHEVEIKGPSRFIFRPEKPLACGAHLWIETDAEVSYS